MYSAERHHPAQRAGRAVSGIDGSVERRAAMAIVERRCALPGGYISTAIGTSKGRSRVGYDVGD